jgi:hypothetical protein
MSKAAVEYIQLVYFYRLFLIRYIYLSNLTSLLVETEEEGHHSTSSASAGQDPLIEENENTQKPLIERSDCFEKGRIGLTVTGKELDEETGLYYFGHRYLDSKFSSWISTDPALVNYVPTGAELFFPEKAFNANSLKGAGGVYNSKNINLYHYAGLNPLKYVDPDGNDSVKSEKIMGSLQYTAPYTMVEKNGMLMKVNGDSSFGAGNHSTDMHSDLPLLIINTGSKENPNLKLLIMKESNFGVDDNSSSPRNMKAEIYSVKPAFDKQGKVIGIQKGELLESSSNYHITKSSSGTNGEQLSNGKTLLNPNVVTETQPDAAADTQHDTNTEQILQGLGASGFGASP